MFSRQAMAELLKNNRPLFDDLLAVEAHLNARFFGLSDQIHCLMLAVASGESMLMIGPPGTAKSRLIRAFAQMCDLLSEEEFTGSQKQLGSAALREYPQEPRYFEYLLTPFTEPGELFGFFDIGKLFDEQTKSGQLERLHQGMMQHAEIIFLDEVFNASSAILNSLLTFINERKFHDRGKTYEVNLSCLFGATNFPPKRPELLAIYDRFLLRTWVDNVPAEPGMLGSLLEAGWRETNAADLKQDFPQLLARAEAFRAHMSQLSAQGGLSVQLGDDQAHHMITRLNALVVDARRRRLSQLSNRRLVRFSKIFLVNALMRAARDGSSEPRIKEDKDLALLMRFGLDRMPGDLYEHDAAGLLVKGQL